MRLLLIGALAATLVGCSSAQQQAQQSFGDATRRLHQARQEWSPQMNHPKQAGAIAAKKENAGYRRKAKANIRNAVPSIVRKMLASSSSMQPDDITTSTIAAKVETPPSSRPDGNSDPVITKAKVRIAAKMGNPSSVEFVEMTVSTTKYAAGNPVETICGFVKNTNGADTPFLYLVQKDEAYIGGYTLATGAYRNICPITR